jgi:hypothetical protein
MSTLSRLTDDDVVEIRARIAFGEKIDAISFQFSISDKYARQIALRHRWLSVPWWRTWQWEGFHCWKEAGRTMT